MNATLFLSVGSVRWWLAFGLMAFVFQLRATHIIGGEMHYQWISGNTYEVTLKLYRDCGPANSNNTYFDDEVVIGVFVGGIYVSATAIGSPSYRVLDRKVDNPCLILPPEICVEEATYVGELDLPSATATYQLVYQRCCRNGGIVNIENAADYGLTLTCVIPPVQQRGNSSPRFKNIMPLGFCLDDDVEFDHSAIDIDGDSLVYELTAPYTGGSAADPRPEPPAAPPFAQLPWSLGYSNAYPILSNPAIVINPNTGLLTLRPTVQGIYAVAVSVKEYRNGVLLSESIRDFQFVVTRCVSDTKAGIEPQSEFCQGLQIPVKNASTNARFFLWRTVDLEQPFDSSTAENPILAFPDDGNYSVFLITNAGFPCADTAEAVFSVLEGIKLQLDSQEVQCVTNQSFSLRASGEHNANYTYQWTLPDGSLVTNDFDSVLTGVTFPNIGYNRYECNVSFGTCNLNLLDSVYVESSQITADFEDQTEFCAGLVYQFVNQSTQADFFEWQLPFGRFFDKDPLVSFPDTGLFNVTLIAGRTDECQKAITKTVAIYPNFQAFFALQDTVCLDDGQLLLQADTSLLSSSAQFIWSPFGPTAAGRAYLYSLSLNQEGWRPVEVAVSDYGCQKIFSDSVYIQSNPDPTISVTVNAGCVPHGVGFQLTNPPQQAYLVDWDFGYLDFGSRLRNPFFVYQQAGQYTPSCTVTTISGCRDTVNLISPTSVEVYENPKAEFELDTVSSPLLEPFFRASATPFEGLTYQFSVAGNIIGRNPDIDFQYAEAGRHALLLTVVDTNGCESTLERFFEVTGHQLFAPSAFTPDDDGINDQFKVVCSRYRAFACTIFDRFGSVLFETSDAAQGWNGQGGLKQCSSGSYPYLIEITDMQGLKTVYRGNVILLR
ncbi:MAG TPA: gliding motility-associated C-terminal domain-containing protein [Luteibaculaceae bacterium]|nr:gliding motility-associated C-terminal domain-containing protein [Luteibaculaceae bacterium]